MVNCTSLGMHGTGTEAELPCDPAQAAPGALFVDIVYAPENTAWLQAARAAGVRGIGVTWGAASAEELRAAEPTAVVHSVGELQTLLGL